MSTRLRFGIVAIRIKGISVDLFFLGPESLVQKRLLPFESLRELLAEIFFAQEMSEVRKRAQGFKSQRCLIKLNPRPDRAVLLRSSRCPRRRSGLVPAHRRWIGEIRTLSRGCPISAEQTQCRRCASRNRSQ